MGKAEGDVFFDGKGDGSFADGVDPKGGIGRWVRGEKDERKGRDEQG